MARSNADLLAIKAELTNDPLDLGLTTAPADDEANANALNLVRPALLVDRKNVPENELRPAFNRTEYAAATAADRQWIDLQLKAGLVNTAATEVRAGFLAIFGVGTATRTNLVAMLQEPANRIEHLFRAGTLEMGGTVTPSDVANARNAV